MLHVAVLGAFPFPVPQGSQVYAADQARALVRAGARVTFLAYGRGAGRAPPDLDVVSVPRSLAPRRLRAGPSAWKPVADLALLAVFSREHARRRFDAVLAHHAEAALIALSARTRERPPLVYAAHAILARELPSYAPRPLAGALARLGAALDTALARRCDAVLALTSEAVRVLGASARGPVARIPPGLEPSPPPARARVEAVCVGHGLRVGSYAVYAGNLDAYQNLGMLARAAALAPELSIVVVTHARVRADLRPLRLVRVADVAAMRALVYGAGAAVLPRRIGGGFPIKLLNYMEAGRALVAFEGVADTLEHDVSAWLLGADSGPEAFANALTQLLGDPVRAARLGRGARAVLDAEHAWPVLAARTLRLLEALGARDRPRDGR